MKNQLLTLFFCLFLPATVLIIVAILGTISRLKTADKIMQGIEDGRFQDLSEPHRSRRMKIRACLALACLVIFILIIVLTLLRLISYNVMLIGLLFAVAGSICGYLNYREVIKLSKP
jgi:hypothetical protein